MELEALLVKWYNEELEKMYNLPEEITLETVEEEKRKMKVVRNHCEGCGRELTTFITDDFPLCQDCDNHIFNEILE
jgi:predicted transcriptional regulator